MQFYMGADSASSQARSRNLTGGLAGVKDIFSYPLAKPLPDASYAMFTLGTTWGGDTGHKIDVWKVKLPPLPAPDATDRTKFVPISVSLTAPTGLGVARAALKFGYREYGAAGQYYCSSRAEACIANSSTAPVNDGLTAPFQFVASNSWTGVSCAASCMVVLPALPVHLVYYQAQYLDAGGTVVATGPMQVAGDFSAPTSGGIGTQLGGSVRFGGSVVIH
jgi:hypothetical protein